MVHRTRRQQFISSVRAALEERARALRHTVDRELDALAGEQERQASQRDMEDSDPALGLLELEGLELEQLDHALDRIDAGAYGVCEACAEEIPERRLRALPMATRCVGCQREADGAGERGSR